jgi:putative ABC transport system permease protein
MEWSFFTENDEKNMRKVAVLGESVSDDLFEDQYPIWKKIKIWNDIFTVIGKVEEDMAVSRWVYIPLSTAKVRTVWANSYSVIFLSTKNWDLIDATKNEIEEWLRKFYGIKEWNKSNFNVTTQKDFLEIVDKIMWIMSTFLACIAAISLLVWWIWVMNIMLVSVTERTKEIWIRKAIWAKKSDIVSQFLAESVLMTVIWWIIWILLSVLVVWTVNHVQDTIHAVITVKSVLIAVLSSISIGLIFGIMPAKNAAKLKPIDALRFE